LGKKCVKNKKSRKSVGRKEDVVQENKEGDEFLKKGPVIKKKGEKRSE